MKTRSRSAKDLNVTMNESRQKLFEESRFDPKNQKYGLFSYSGSLAISRTPYFIKTMSHKILKEGKPYIPIKQKNFSNSVPKRGKTPDTYFSTPAYIPEPPIQKPKKDSQADKPKFFINEKWKAGSYAEPISLYPHEPSFEIKKINKRGPDGLIITEPRNFFTSPPRTGSAATTINQLFDGSQFEYIPQLYEQEKRLRLEEEKKNKAKMLTRAFKPSNPLGGTFNKNSKVFGEVQTKKRLVKTISYTGFSQERPFNSTIPYNHNTIGKFPEYIPDPLKSPKRSAPSEAIPWKASTKERSKPSPSISNSVINIRSDYPVLKIIH